MNKIGTETIIEIYNKLGDDKSKRIFENNLLFSQTENIMFMKNIINLSYPDEFAKCEERIEKYLDNSGIKKDDEVIVYGAGGEGIRLLIMMSNINVVAFCDTDPAKHGKIYCGYNVISPEELKNRFINNKVIITVGGDLRINKIKNTLKESGISDNQIYVFTKMINECNIYDIYVKIKEQQYFDSEIIISRYIDDEVFIDAGCCDFYTDICFINNSKNKYEKIIAFEPDSRMYPVCVENSKKYNNAEILNSGLWNINTELYFDNLGMPHGGARVSDISETDFIKIKAVTLDDVLKGDKATFIKMDVEGAELNALIGCEKTIKKYHPKLAISIYHKPEDIWEIPAYILSLNNNYKLYLRHYSLWQRETVIYAV